MTQALSGDGEGMRGARWPWYLGATACGLFAISAAAYSLSLILGAPDLWSLIQSAVTSDAYTYGPQSSSSIMRPIYSAQIGSVAVHTLAGAVAFIAAMTQFVPAIRHSAPCIHRATGALVVFLVLVMTIASLWMLLSRPLDASFSGEVFTIGLGSLGGLTVLTTILAALAVRARRFKMHMGWMALMFACLLTAPVMRMLWIVYGWFSGLPMVNANLAIVLYLLPLCALVMAVWMRRIGERDLGAMPMQSFLPALALRPLGMIAAAVILHEGVLAPLGLDALSAWRASADRLPLAGVFWGLCAAAAAWRAPSEMARLEQGAGMTTLGLGLGGLAGLSALILAAAHGRGDLQAIAQASYFAAWGLEILLLVVLGRRARGATKAWDAQWLSLALAPALWPLLALTFAPLGMGAAGTATAAYMDAYAVSAALGFASAFGLRIVAGRAPARRAQAASAPAA